MGSVLARLWGHSVGLKGKDRVTHGRLGAVNIFYWAELFQYFSRKCCYTFVFLVNIIPKCVSNYNIYCIYTTYIYIIVHVFTERLKGLFTYLDFFLQHL